MKEVVYLILAIHCLCCVLAGQNLKSRTIEDGYKWPNMPIEIVGRSVGETKFEGNQALAADDWLSGIRLEVKNTSSRNITFIDLELFVPKQGLMPSPYAISIEFPNLVDDSLKNRKEAILRPGDVVTLRMSEAQTIKWIEKLMRDGVSSVEKIRIDPRLVIYDDDTGWNKGLDVVRDPTSTKKKHYIPRNRIPRSPTLFSSVFPSLSKRSCSSSIPLLFVAPTLGRFFVTPVRKVLSNVVQEASPCGYRTGEESGEPRECNDCNPSVAPMCDQRYDDTMANIGSGPVGYMVPIGMGCVKTGANPDVDQTCWPPNGCPLDSVWRFQAGVNTNWSEDCNNLDDNCDGNVDEGYVCPPACPNAYPKPPLQYLCPQGSYPDPVNPAYCCPNCNQEPDICESPNGAWSWITCQCEPGTPVIIDLAGNGFNLTNFQNGVSFDLDGNGAAEQLGWTSGNSDDAFLALDINSNNTIDSGRELFGNFTLQPKPAAGVEANGFLALAVYDKVENGGNNDGKITQADAVFNQLRLWQDSNHNGFSEAGELRTLPQHGLKTIELDYKESKKTDAHGNKFKYRAKVKDAQGAQLGRGAWDVVLVRE